MSKKITSALVWFRNDLRVEDHRGLNQAIASYDNVIAYYTFNPNHYGNIMWGFKKTEKYRAKFLIESIEYLKAALKKLNITLVIDQRSPQQTIPQLVKKYHVKSIYLQKEWTKEELDEETDEIVAKQFYSAEIRSVSENVAKPVRTLSVKMLTPHSKLVGNRYVEFTNKNIVVNIPNVRKEVLKPEAV